MGADCRGRLGWLTLLLFLAFLLAPFPLAGKITFERTYGGIEFDWGQSVQQTQDGGYIVAGQTQSFGPWDYDVYLVKTDSVGDTVWTRTYGGNHDDAGWSVQQTQDGGYIVAGYTGFSGGYEEDVYLVKTNSLGDTVWTRTYGGIDYDNGYSVQQTQDGGYVIAGFTVSFGVGSRDVYLIKTDENGLTGADEKGTAFLLSHRAFRLFQNSPNPLRQSTSISYSLPVTTEVTLSIYDITGRLVETLVNETQQRGAHQVQWNRKANPSGVYFYRLNAGSFTVTKKMVAVE